MPLRVDISVGVVNCLNLFHFIERDRLDATETYGTHLWIFANRFVGRLSMLINSLYINCRLLCDAASVCYEIAPHYIVCLHLH